MFNINFCPWPLESEATALPTEPQPLPPLLGNYYFNFSRYSIFHIKGFSYVRERFYIKVGFKPFQLNISKSFEEISLNIRNTQDYSTATLPIST